MPAGFVCPDCAGVCTCGGVAPIAFRRSIIPLSASALPSTSTVIGKPSIEAVIENFATACGCAAVIGVTFSVPSFIGVSLQLGGHVVLQADFRRLYCDGQADATEAIIIKH